MRLFSGKVPAIAAEVVKALVAGGDIEAESSKEVVRDVEAVLEQYVEAERQVNDRAKDILEQRGLGQGEFNRVKRLAAEQSGIKTGEDTLDYLLDQVVEMLLHSANVDEVFAEDHDLRRRMVPIFKKHMAADEELDRDVRGQLKHVQEGTSKWEVEYQRILGDIKRRKGLG